MITEKQFESILISIKERFGGSNDLEDLVIFLGEDYLNRAKKERGEIVDNSLYHPNIVKSQAQIGNDVHNFKHGEILLSEYNFTGLLDILEKEVKRTMRDVNSIEMWDESIYNLFKEFRDNIQRIRRDE